MSLTSLHPKNFEFWLLLFFVLRLPTITQPPLEKGHNWRQSTGLMVTRNFDEPNASLFYPTVNETGAQKGVVGMEFPILYYTHHLVAKVFGYKHWYGRLINLILSSLGILFFFKLLSHFLTKQQAFYASFILLVSIWLTFSRKTMPDTASVSLVFIGLYFGYQYFLVRKAPFLLLYFLFTTLGILIKIPAIIYLPVLAISILKNLKKYYPLAIASIISAGLVYYWYFVWNVHLVEEFGNWYNQGMTFKEGFTELKNNLHATLKKFYWSSFYSYIFFLLFLIGLYPLRKYKEVLYAIVPVTLLFLAYMVKSGFYFHHHNYYIIPFVPVMAISAGVAISLIPKVKWQYVLILAGTIEAIANQQHDFFVPKNQLYKIELEKIAQEHIPKNKLVVGINGSGNPQMLYLLNRKGWVLGNNPTENSQFIQNISTTQADYLIVDKNSFTLDQLPAFSGDLVMSSNDYNLYRVAK